jgi:energy-coupling factor transporter ATP-binding protein EcfA2
MRIESVRIQNLRSMKDETIRFGNYTCLVGPNGSGKSNVLCALSIFFRETDNYVTDLCSLDEEDFHHRNTGEPVTITLTFTHLSPQAKDGLADYVRQDRLIVSAIASFDATSGKAEVKQYGQRLGIRAFAPFFEAEKDSKTKVADLKSLYSDIRATYSALPPPGTRDGMKQALWDYETARSGECELIPSEDQFYGWRGSNRLAPYVQWVYIPAVKDASTEQVEARNTALGKLLARTVRTKTDFSGKLDALSEGWQQQYEGLLTESQAALDDLSSALARRLAEWSHPDARAKLTWRQDKSLEAPQPLARLIAGEGRFEGELPRFGHGLQRCYLFALLQKLAAADDANQPTLVLGCEEPELYQHPPQARHLSGVLQELSQHNSQVVVCTHSPHFVSGKGFEDVRMVRMQEHRSVVSQATYEQVGGVLAAARVEAPAKLSGLLAKLHQALQPALNEMFFTSKLILVEGSEDIAYIAAYLDLMGLWDEYRRYACHMVPTEGKSTMIQPVAVAKSLRIPTYVVFDGDGDKPDTNGSRRKHEKDNAAILRLCGFDDPEPFPPRILFGEGVTMWNSDISAVVTGEIGTGTWMSYSNAVDQEYRQIGGLRKNGLHIAKCLELAWKDNRKSEALQKLCYAVMEFGRSN